MITYLKQEELCPDCVARGVSRYKDLCHTCRKKYAKNCFHATKDRPKAKNLKLIKNAEWARMALSSPVEFQIEKQIKIKEKEIIALKNALTTYKKTMEA